MPAHFFAGAAGLMFAGRALLFQYLGGLNAA
jgi:hypothetical protein